MKPEEIELLQSKNNAAIIAPAGHGKTEMIVDLVQASNKKVLLVTHTNAGIDALTKRLKKRGIDNNRYTITTIASFCMRWCSAYPRTADIRDIPVTAKEYYPMHYCGTASIFKNDWARQVLALSYGSVIVDEYQDCVLDQHQIFIEINKTLPVIVLGDPLQAIFGWAGKLVSWNDICFEKVKIETFPWRWNKTNPALGAYLSEIRHTLLPGLSGQRVSIVMKPVEGCVQVAPSSCKHDLSIMQMIKGYKSVLFITKWPNEQSAFCQSTGGLFQNDEPQGLNYLYEIAEKLDERSGITSVITVMDFLENSATRVNQELGTYRKHINDGNFDFSKIRKHREFGGLIMQLYETPSISSILSVLNWIKDNGEFKLYRKELFYELCRALKYAEANKLSILEASQRIRMLPGLQRKYPGFRLLSSRTVLSKGLEFECVIIDMGKAMTVTDYYVAMTRATKQIVLICDRPTAILEAPKL